MTPIHPDHRSEIVEELEDLARMLRTSEVITYEDLSQRLSQVIYLVQLWQPELAADLHREGLGPAQQAYYRHAHYHPDQLSDRQPRAGS